jgi:hypothetical protein
MLNQGYISITRLLASPEETAAQEEYEILKASFQEIEHGESFVQQLDTAFKVFST